MPIAHGSNQGDGHLKNLFTITCRVFVDALLALLLKVQFSGYVVTSRRARDFEQPRFGESAVGRSTFPFSFIQRRHSRAKSTDIGMPSGRKLSVA